MIFRTSRALLLAGVLALGIAACQEQLTAPGVCPATCPGGVPVVHDTVLEAIADSDQTYVGYIVPGSGFSGLRTSNGFLGTTDRAVILFDSMPSMIKVRDTLRTFTIDSAYIDIPLLKRDTLQSGIMLWLHRLPATVDTSATFAEIESYVVPGTVFDSVTVPDSIKAAHTFRFVFKGDTLNNIAIPAGDSGVLGLAVAMTAPVPTGVRVGGAGSTDAGGVPAFRYFITVDVPDTATSVRKQVVVRGVTFTRYVTSNPTALDPDLLTLGTMQDARAMIRFPWPAYLRDSALLARATLELTPDAPFAGLPGDSAWVNLYGITVDYGPKSPLAGGVNGLRGTRPLIFGSADTMRIDIIAEVQFWQSGVLAIPHPPVLVAKMDPAGGASYTEPRFRSTRSGGGAPRLRITYQLPFDFERP
jgi:hypothetical protein